MRFCINVKVFGMDYFAIFCHMNMVTQIIYLGRVEVGDWHHAVVFVLNIFIGFYGSLDLNLNENLHQC